MKPPITNCHNCYLANRMMPAIWADTDGTFYCNPCRKDEGLEESELMTVRAYLASKGFDERKTPRGQLADRGAPTTTPESAEAGKISQSDDFAQKSEVSAARPVSNPASPWRKFGSLGMNSQIPPENDGVLDEPIEAIEPNTEKQTEEEMSKNGSCGCGRPAEHRGRCSFRRANGGPAAKAAKKAARSTVLTPPCKPDAIVSTGVLIEARSGNPVAALMLTDAQMVRIFAALTTEDKKAALQGLFDQLN